MQQTTGGIQRVVFHLARGVLTGAVAAALAITVFPSESEDVLAAGFLLIAAEIVALLLGPITAICALVTGALSLIYFAFQPIGSLYVDSITERTALAWILAGGVPLCLAVSLASLGGGENGNDRGRSRVQGNE